MVVIEDLDVAAALGLLEEAARRFALLLGNLFEVRHEDPPHRCRTGQRVVRSLRA